MAKPKRPPEFYMKKHGIPVKLGRALIGQESGGDDEATSPKNAAGRMQIHLPSHPNVTEAQARDPDFAMDYGFKLLAGHKAKFGSWRLALAAYNAGAGAVEEFGGVPPYRETQNYVRSILSKAGAFTTPSQTQKPGSSTPLPGIETEDELPLAKPAAVDRRALALSGVQRIAQGEHDPTEALGDLVTATREAAAAMPEPVEADPLAEPTEFEPEATDQPDADLDWKEWVRVPQPRGNSSAPHGPEILGFVAQIARARKRKLEVWDNTTHSKYTVNGNVSAHHGGQAADIPARGAELRRLGYLALVAAGMPKKAALKASRQGGLYNVGNYQIIFATDIGGNHHDHLHVGRRG